MRPTGPDVTARAQPRRAGGDTGAPWEFFLLTLALSLPVYGLSRWVHIAGTPKNMPVLDAALAFVPLTAALILAARHEGAPGAARLLRRAVDLGRIRAKRWYAPVLLLAPFTLLVTYAGMHLLGVDLPDQPRLPIAAMAVLPFAFLVAAVGEELGWTGYATDPLQHRWGPLAAGLVVGTVWWAWHIPSILASGQTPLLIALGALGAIGGRVLWVWIYNGSGGSVGAIILTHAVSNVCGSYVPSVPTPALGPVTAALAAAVAGVWWARSSRGGGLRGRTRGAGSTGSPSDADRPPGKL
ncbi:CPBP family intramembrane metalloprotease [Streptomonospora sp. PA3]|uniref:CPBP family intramembrane glutamic endopeptidase n=1 Tax=Streptomonospora sp. PA3 TaxID=2607326 RepID=UPI0012DC9284|nr:type II CAAX endopeptidase family protein [Streptomonospora sp. PA3]MUL43696.1 CPBP family intramembrane metalloprotease [Streptomonospora sp. PA3]